MRSNPGWDSGLYLKFERERTLPCRDLVGRIDLAGPGTIADLGCGPGTSTAVLAERWPQAAICGVDASAEMLEVARVKGPAAEWVRDDLRTWTPSRPVDLVFSNAALHWVPDHPRLIPRLWGFVAQGGALAFQAPPRETPLPAWVAALSEVRGRPRWAAAAGAAEGGSSVLPPEQYYDLLAPQARQVLVWDTTYEHVLGGPTEVVEWVKGAGLRPTLEALRSDVERREFLAEYTEEISRRYPRRRDGNVLLPFLRRFVVAYR